MADTEQDRMENAQNDWANRMAWFLTGAVIGVTAALLYAPQRGSDTRKYISDKAHQGRDAVTGTSKDIVDAGREMFERGRKLVEDAAELFERGRKLVKG